MKSSHDEAQPDFRRDLSRSNLFQAFEDLSLVVEKRTHGLSNGKVIKASAERIVEVKQTPDLHAPDPQAHDPGALFETTFNEPSIWYPTDLEDFLLPSFKVEEAQAPAQEPARVEMPEIDLAKIQEMQELEQTLQNLREQIEASRREMETQAAAILGQARREADEVLMKAFTEAEEARRQAQADIQTAIQRGWDSGFSKATDKVRSEAVKSLETASEIVRSVKEWRQAALPACEGQVLDMVREIARAMFGDGIALDAEALQMNFNRILENTHSLGDLKIFAHPADAAQLDSAWRQMQFSLTGNQIQIIPSETIKPGGCYIEGQMGVLDARIETQLKAIWQSIDEERTHEYTARPDKNGAGSRKTALEQAA